MTKIIDLSNVKSNAMQAALKKAMEEISAGWHQEPENDNEDRKNADLEYASDFRSDR